MVSSLNAYHVIPAGSQCVSFLSLQSHALSTPDSKRNSASVTLPTQVALGHYVISHEIIALGIAAVALSGAEFYPAYSKSAPVAPKRVHPARPSPFQRMQGQQPRHLGSKHEHTQNRSHTFLGWTRVRTPPRPQMIKLVFDVAVDIEEPIRRR